MKRFAPIDAVFWALDSGEHPMHIAALQLFSPPDGSGPRFAPGNL